MTVKLLLLGNAFAIWAYVFWQGVERFYIESFGTLVLSPLIYIRICPSPLKEWMIRAANGSPFLCNLISLVPLLVVAAALFVGFRALRKNSLPLAIAACLLMSSVFIAYHSVKHLGLQCMN